MYLSKVTLAQSTQAADVLVRYGRNGVYGLHQLLWQLFSQDTQRGFLFREEQGGAGLPCFYILSEQVPQSGEGIFCIQSKAFAPKLQAKQRLAFKLRVNPTICVADESGKRRRHDVLMHAKYQLKGQGSAAELKQAMEQAALAWIAKPERLAQWGVSLAALPEIECYTQHKSHKKTGNHPQFSSVDFQGVLTVEEPELFLLQHAKGFGRAKAFGCGLMLIRSL